jgi:phosphosulfolactate synthase
VVQWASAKEAVLASGAPSDRLVFEAPQRYQRIHFIGVIGANVNLDNIRMNNLVSLEILRCGLHFENVEYHGMASG